MRHTSRLLSFALCALLYGCQSTAPILPAPTTTSSTSSEPTTRIAIIGDYGSGNEHQAAVSLAVKSQNPDYIFSVGDNNYGLASELNSRVGRYYGDYILRPTGLSGADLRSAISNRFFPALGNHDWDAGIRAYTDYFSLPGNERYYQVHITEHELSSTSLVDMFVVDSDRREPDGNTPGSIQEQWLKKSLLASTGPWKVIVMHEPAYTSPSRHTSSRNMRWAFTGATLVLQGHNHFYERLQVDKLTYVTTGNGGKNLYQLTGPRKDGSVMLNTEHYGYVLLDATPTTLTLTAHTSTGGVIDRKTWAR
jgi:predicted phosphodiesterase